MSEKKINDKIKKYLLNYYKYVMGKNFTDKRKFDLLYIKKLEEKKKIL